MKKYIPVDFDEKGNAVLGRERNTPTSNGFIPTTWAPGGGGEDGNGIKSITISPAITTTPALESFFPIYWEDLTDEQKQDGVPVVINANIEDDVQYTFTITPTADFYAASFDGVPGFGGKGEPITITQTMSIGQSYNLHVAAANGTTEETATETVIALVGIGTIPDGE